MFVTLGDRTIDAAQFDHATKYFGSSYVYLKDGSRFIALDITVEDVTYRVNEALREQAALDAQGIDLDALRRQVHAATTPSGSAALIELLNLLSR